MKSPGLRKLRAVPLTFFVMAMPGCQLSTFGVGSPVPSRVAVDRKLEGSRSQAPISSFFQFHLGDRWTYLYRQSEQGTGGRVYTNHGRYEDEVVAIEIGLSASVQVVGVKRYGEAPGEARCEADPKSRGDAAAAYRFWYVIDDSHVFSSCTRDAAFELAAKLTKSPWSPIAGQTLEYVYPFRVGDVWGADPSDPKRDDTLYQWRVDKKFNVRVPAGSFESCYSMVFATLPDRELKTVCPKVGLVTDEYEHHGTITRWRVELQSFRSGVARSKK